MNQQQALEILVKAVEIAQSKGAYSLDDAAVLKTAILTTKARYGCLLMRVSEEIHSRIVLKVSEHQNPM